jgi:branched-chain amino acid transport system substrate-binding protein
VKKWIWFALVAGALALASDSQWRSLDRMAERRSEATAKPSTEMLVGVCWPSSVNRDGMVEGLQLAADQINARQPKSGPTIRLAIRDDAYDWQRAKEIAVEFSDTPEMSAVIGYYDDEPSVKASAIYESSKLLHMILGANNTAMTQRGFEYLVRTVLSSEKIALSLARTVIHRQYKRVAVIWEEDAYGEDLAYQFRVGLDTGDVAGARLVYQWSFSRDRADFRDPVNELKAANADVIFFAGLEPWAGDFLRVARAVGLATPVVGAFSDTPEMRARAGKAIEGAMYFDFYDVDSPSPANQAFVRQFQARYGQRPGTFAAQGYDAMHILANAVRHTGSRNPLDLSYAIRFMGAWDGANGRYKFDRTGEIGGKPMFLKAYERGEPVVVEIIQPASEQASR